jgi:sugar phosphate isomerase/epimerase
VAELKIGIQTHSLRLPLKQALFTASELGAAGVEIDLRNELRPEELSQTGLRQFRKLLDDHNLRVSAASFPTRRGYGDATDLDRRVAATQQAMDFAGRLGARVLVNRIGHVPSEDTDPRFARMVEALTAIGLYGDRVGVQFAAQTASESGPQLATLIAQLPDGTVGVDLHPAALIQGGFSVPEAVDALGPHVIHVHACDAVRDFSQQRVVEVELGRGVAEMPDILGRIEEFNYQGWVTIERRDSPDPRREIANAVAYLKAL